MAHTLAENFLADLDDLSEGEEEKNDVAALGDEGDNDDDGVGGNGKV